MAVVRAREYRPSVSFCTDLTALGPYPKTDLGPIFSQYVAHTWLIRYVYYHYSASPHAANDKESTWMYQRTFKFHYRCLNIVKVKKGQRVIHRITPEIRFLTTYLPNDQLNLASSGVKIYFVAYKTSESESHTVLKTQLLPLCNPSV